MSEQLVICGYARTPMGGMMGSLAEVPAPVLGSAAIGAAMRRAGVNADAIDEVLMGCVLPAGLGQSPARQAALGAGLPVGVGTTTVNKMCGSGMKTVMMACDTLGSGQSDMVVAGGMESMSNAPYLLNKARSGYRIGHGEMLDHMYIDGLQDAYSGDLMGAFAEQCADKYTFTREGQDAYALESLRRASVAIAEGKFRHEIEPVTVKSRRAETVVEIDEQPGNAKPERIPHLGPAFRENGTVTAANASSISDGAAALILTRQSVAQAKGLKPIAAIRGYTQFAQEPEWFTTAPVGAMNKLLDKTGWSVADVDLFEINEAFAVVAMAAMRELGLPHDKVNVHGGACALGHPLGASGARIIVTLLAALQTYGKSKGVASLCIGGGEATAVAVELL